MIKLLAKRSIDPSPSVLPCPPPVTSSSPPWDGQFLQLVSRVFDKRVQHPPFRTPWSRWALVRRPFWKRAKKRVAAVQVELLLSAISMGLVVALRLTGHLEALELQTLAHLTHLHHQAGLDARILVVEITESDINYYRQSPLSDRRLAEALAKIQQYQPRVIGLDLYRNLSYDPGSGELQTQLKASNLVAIEQLGGENVPAIPAPAEMRPEQIGFSDLVLDSDDTVRRALLYAEQGQEKFYSFALRLALNYLHPASLRPDAEAIQLGDRWLSILAPQSGGYQTLDARGYQILLQYRNFHLPARHISLQQLLNDQFQPEWIQGKAILVGTGAPSAKDFFKTPLSTGSIFFSPGGRWSTPSRLATDLEMSGVDIHAHILSQLLGQVLDQRVQFWVWPDWLENGWIGVWVMISGRICWGWRRARAHQRWRWVLALACGLGALVLANLGLAKLGGWIPAVPALLGFGQSVVLLLGYHLLQRYRRDDLTGLPNRQWLLNRLNRYLQFRKYRPTQRRALAGLGSGLSLNQTWLDKTSSNSFISNRTSSNKIWPNKTWANKTWRSLFTPSPRSWKVGLLLIELKSFRAIGNSFGPSTRENLLRNSRDRIARNLHHQDQLTWIDDVGFAVLRPRVRNVQVLLHLADRLSQDLSYPGVVDRPSVYADWGIGVAVSSIHCQTGEELLRNAATASAQTSIHQRFQVFDPDMRDRLLSRLQISTDLQQALLRQEFELYYQPIIDLAQGSIYGFEALLRWNHPQYGLISPSDFIAIAEEIGVIVPLGRWLLDQACSQIKRWQQQFPTMGAHPDGLVISVNLSSQQLFQENLVEQVAHSLKAAGLPGHCLKLEITESMAMTEMEKTAGLLLRLRDLGLQLGLDDFGTGYSSLSYLNRLPTNTLKLDRSFVSRMGFALEDFQIVQTIINLAHTLGMDVVAEGIEDSSQYEVLRSLHCEYGQGFLFSKPLPAHQVEAFLQSYTPWI